MCFHALPYRYNFLKMSFTYPKGSFGPCAELRSLKDIRQSLRNPDCQGPEIVYSIAMDVGYNRHLNDLKKRNLLYGAVIYNSGKLGDEPIRSQGHIHAVSSSCASSTAELYEIHSGVGVIYMQEYASATDKRSGRCFAVIAHPGELVLVPPGWAHMTISAAPNQPLAFGAWCVRDYGFEYEGVRAHRGLAYFPLLENKNEEKPRLYWQANPTYEAPPLIEKSPENYANFGIQKNKDIYEQYEEQPHRFDFIPQPRLAAKLWKNFVP